MQTERTPARELKGEEPEGKRPKLRGGLIEKLKDYPTLVALVIDMMTDDELEDFAKKCLSPAAARGDASGTRAIQAVNPPGGPEIDSIHS